MLILNTTVWGRFHHILRSQIPQLQKQADYLIVFFCAIGIYVSKRRAQNIVKIDTLSSPLSTPLLSKTLTSSLFALSCFSRVAERVGMNGSARTAKRHDRLTQRLTTAAARSLRMNFD